jgi:hypothetical protein
MLQERIAGNPPGDFLSLAGKAAAKRTVRTSRDRSPEIAFDSHTLAIHVNAPLVFLSDRCTFATAVKRQEIDGANLPYQHRGARR